MKDGGQSFEMNVSSATIVRLALWLLVFWFIYSIRKLILIVLISVVIASAVEPAVRWFGRFHVPRTPAVLLVYLLAFILLFSLIPLFFIPVFGDLVQISTTLPEKLSALQSLALPNNFLSSIANSNYFANLATNLQAVFAGLSSGFLQTVTAIFGGVFSFVMIVVISFYLAVQNDGIGNFLRLVSPARYEKYIVNLWHRSEKKIGLWMQGQLLLGLIVGVIVYLGLTVAGFYIIMQQFENHLLYPLVVKKIVGVPSLVAILSLIIGAQLAGFLGIILAVPVATILMELLNDFEQRKKLAPENA